MPVTYQFGSLESIAEHFAEKAKHARQQSVKRSPRDVAAAWRGEAAAYEQAAHVLRCAALRQEYRTQPKEPTA